VVVASYRSGATLEACLRGLDRQTRRDFEAIVVDSSPRRPVPGPRPWLVVDHSDRRLGPHAARNRGATRARGELIVFTDADCEARPGWLDRLAAAHDAGHAVVGGAVEPAGAGVRERGIHVCKFGPWSARAPAGRRPVLPTANLSWRRDAWERAGPFRLEGWSGDTELCLRARRSGLELVFTPEAIVEHHHEVRVGAFLRERAERGAAFARVRSQGWPRWRVGAQLAGAPAVPAVLLFRTLASAARAGWLREALPAVPVMLAGYAAWAAGEARGLAAVWRGRGREAL
jgi:GT2 family glycosyltransferase